MTRKIKATLHHRTVWWWDSPAVEPSPEFQSQGEASKDAHEHGFELVFGDEAETVADIPGCDVCLESAQFVPAGTVANISPAVTTRREETVHRKEVHRTRYLSLCQPCADSFDKERT